MTFDAIVSIMGHGEFSRKSGFFAGFGVFIIGLGIQQMLSTRGRLEYLRWTDLATAFVLINAEIGAAIQSIGDGRGSSLDIGFAKRMQDNNFTILVDYIDFYDNNKENVFNKIHMGVEYKVQVLALRAGLNSGYPAVGFGLNSRVFDIDMAYYGEELTKGPGGDEESRYIIQIKFGW